MSEYRYETKEYNPLPALIAASAKALGGVAEIDITQTDHEVRVALSKESYLEKEARVEREKKERA